MARFCAHRLHRNMRASFACFMIMIEKQRLALIHWKLRSANSGANEIYFAANLQSRLAGGL
jgi:hypothetical protein